ncbi:uncharacterized protein LOC130357922 isoform X2 [Hyla sarda]|nr:uncharacterized protein LOC130357922 isoform X2 [Hyla sarda]
MGSVTITFNYDTYWYRNLISSWCRQISMTECENIVDTSVVNHNEDNGRVFISQINARIGIVNVTMVNLQHWDTGLYKWRIWTGTDYSIIENVLLQVVFGLPSKLHVVNVKASTTVEMNCEYNKKQKWSKAWYKIMGQDKLQWVVHSDGNRNMDYSSRSLVFVNEQKGVLVMKITNLELWDSGLYQCRESGGEIILKEILLLVTSDSKYISPVDVKANFSNGQNSNSTVDGKNEHHRTWDILRWILFLCMGLCVLLFSYYQKFLESLSYIHLMCNRSLKRT